MASVICGATSKHILWVASRCSFTPVDPRCAMELDEVDPAAWERLEAATDDYVASAASQFAAAAAALGASHQQVG